MMNIRLFLILASGVLVAHAWLEILSKIGLAKKKHLQEKLGKYFRVGMLILWPWLPADRQGCKEARPDSLQPNFLKFMTKNVFAVFAGSACALLFYSAGAFGQLSGTSLLVTGTGTVNTLVSGTATIGLLEVTGTADFQDNTWLFGASGTNPGISFVYSDGTSGTNSGFSQTATRPLMSWNWQRTSASGTSVLNAMRLDASNRLILTGTAETNPPQLVLDPNGSITINGSSLLTQTVADALYFPANAGMSAYNGSISFGSSASPALFVNGSSGNVGIGTNNLQSNYGLTIQSASSASGLQIFSGNSSAESVPVFAVGDRNTPLRNWIDSYGIVRFGTGLIIGTSDFNDPIFPGFQTGLKIINRDGGMAAEFRTDSTLDDRAMFRFKSKHSYYMYFGVKYYGGVTQYGFFNSSGDTNNPLMVINDGSLGSSGGQVGIGVINPAAQLEVKSTANHVAAVIQSGTAQTADLTQWKNSSNTVMAVVSSQGKVGIGTSTPQASLDVNGNAKISGNFTTSGTTTIAGPFIVTGTMDVSTNTVVAAGTNQLVLIPQQGDLSMGDFTVGTKPQ